MIEINKYIDIHCHMLPQMDDGAENMETALEMLRCSEKSGAEAVILTPHYYHGRNCYKKGDIEEQIQILREEARKQGISLQLYAGNEILWSDGVLEAVKQGEALPLAGSRYLLVEFYPDMPYSMILKAVRSCIQVGYVPIIAHYERYQAFCQKGSETFISEIREQGALLQMNYASLEGGGFLGNLFGSSRTAWCRKEMQKGHVSFLGTDAHNLVNRTPEHKEAWMWLEKYMDQELLSEILFQNPQAIFDNRQL